MTSAAKASRLMGFPTGLRNINPLAGLPDKHRCESSSRVSCAMTGTGALLCRVFGSSACPLQKDWEDQYLLSVVFLPEEPAQPAFPYTRECRDSYDRRGRFRQYFSICVISSGE